MKEKTAIADFKLCVEHETRTWDFVVSGSGFTLGRTTGASVAVPLRALSSIHLEFVRLKNGNWGVIDKNSTNGTFFGNSKLYPGKIYEVKSSFQLRFGEKTSLNIFLQELDSEPKEKSKTSVTDQFIEAKVNPTALSDRQLKKTSLAAVAELVEAENKKLESLQRELHRLAQEQLHFEQANISGESRLASLKEEITALEMEKSQLQSSFNDLKQELEIKRDSLSPITDQLTEAQADLEDLRNESAAEKAKVEAQIALQKKLTDEIARLQSEEIQSLGKYQEIKHQRDNQLIAVQQNISEELEKKTELTEQIAEATKTLGNLTGEISNLSVAITTTEQQRQSLQAAWEAVRAELRVSEERLTRTLESQKESAARKALIENEIASFTLTLEELQAAVEIEEQSVKEKQTELAHWEKSERARLAADFQTRARELELQLAERHQAEGAALATERTKWEEERAAKRPFEIKEIVRAAAEIFSGQIHGRIESDKIEELKNSFALTLQKVVRNILTTGTSSEVETHLLSSLAQSPTATLKTRAYWKKLKVQGGMVASLVILGLIFPSIPRQIMETGQEFINRTPQSSDRFVAEAKEARANRPKFDPKQETVFRKTFTENLLYAKNYARMKTSEETKKDWTLKLNKFLLQTLDLDENTVVAYMGVEASLVSTLLEMREHIQLESEKVDIQRMTEFEEQTTPRFEAILKSSENYQKLRSFESDFYNNYGSKP